MHPLPRISGRTVFVTFRRSGNKEIARSREELELDVGLFDLHVDVRRLLCARTDVPMPKVHSPHVVAYCFSVPMLRWTRADRGVVMTGREARSREAPVGQVLRRGGRRPSQGDSSRNHGGHASAAMCAVMLPHRRCLSAFYSLSVFACLPVRIRWCVSMRSCWFDRTAA